MAQLMLKPSKDLIERYQIPAEVIAEAYTDNPDHHREAVASLGKVRKLCVELGSGPLAVHHHLAQARPRPQDRVSRCTMEG